jgi:Zn-dependent peptidase ImmA (M78 family)
VNVPSEQRINDLTEALQARLFPWGCKFPIDVEQAIQRLGGTIQESHIPKGRDAIIHREQGTFRIVVDRKLPPTRRKFTILQGLGQILLDQGFLDEVSSGDFHPSVPVEPSAFQTRRLWAHEFTLAFLMPEKAFRKVAAHPLLQDKPGNRIHQVAAFFDVPASVAKIRGQTLGIFGP